MNTSHPAAPWRYIGKRKLTQAGALRLARKQVGQPYRMGGKWSFRHYDYRRDAWRESQGHTYSAVWVARTDIITELAYNLLRATA